MPVGRLGVLTIAFTHISQYDESGAEDLACDSDLTLFSVAQPYVVQPESGK